MKANTIQEVITQLDQVISWSKTNKSRIGYFAVLYRRMTVAVQQGIIHRSFQDGKRMERLDVIFANRYLTAWEAYTTKKPCSSAWCAAFDACKNPGLIVLQHLLLGINTHINLDLCIAAAECAPGDSIMDLQSDFDKINDVIAIESQKVQNTLSNIWFPLRMLTKISNNREEAVLNFSINAARKCSWANAMMLANADDQFKKQHIARVDKMVVELGKRITSPGFAISFLLKPVNMMESKDIPKLIDILKV